MLNRAHSRGDDQHKLAVSSYYDHIAQDYDALYLDRVSIAENQLISDMLAQALPPAPAVLDLGCGTGLGFRLTSGVRPACRYVGIDISTEMVRRAAAIHEPHDCCEFLVGDMADLSRYEEKSFDAVISLFGSFSHALQPEMVCGQVFRVLKERGVAIMMAYSRFSLRSLCKAASKLSVKPLSATRAYRVRNSGASPLAAPARFYTARELRNLFAQFRSVRVRGLNAVFDLAVVKSLQETEITAYLRRMSWEMSILASCPNLAHSLVVTARK